MSFDGLPFGKAKQATQKAKAQDNFASSPVQAVLCKQCQQSRQLYLHVLMQALEERAGDLQRQLLMAQSELKAAQEDAHIHELDTSQLKAQLSGELVQLQHMS